MFTGLVEEIGTVSAITHASSSAVIEIAASRVLSDAALGDSISVSGVCLTVTGFTETGFTADTMDETLRVTKLGTLTSGDRVNLERAVRADTRLGGHLVQGHVDATGTVLSRVPGEGWEVVRISLPETIAKYVAAKGSITVDGISLTVSSVSDDWFEISLIPETLAATTLGDSPVGTLVNLESDIIARHVERLLAANNHEESRA